MNREDDNKRVFWMKVSEWGRTLLVPLAIVLGLFAVSTALAETAVKDVVYPSLGTPEFEQLYYQKVNVLTVDTRNPELCKEISDDLLKWNKISKEQHEKFCEADKERPWTSVFLPAPEYKGTSIRYSELSEKDQKLARQTRNFTVVALGMLGIIYMLPESSTGWEDFDSSGVGKRYIDNIKSGPEWDSNRWAYNYIGHPVSGAAYYQVARHAGFNQSESFAYSFFMSTFFWEYGIEAIEEIPSIQDIFVTPIIGSLIGEYFFQKAKEIRANGGEVLGSKTLGTISLVLMDPAGYVLDFVDGFFGEGVFEDSEFYVTTNKNDNGNAQVEFGFRFWF